MPGFRLKMLSSINERNIIQDTAVLSVEVDMNLMEDVTKELQDVRYEWQQLTAEACLVAENMSRLFLHISMTQKNG